MILVAYYVVLVLVGDLVAVVLCLWIERYWPTASLAIFLAFYFTILLGGLEACGALVRAESEHGA